MPEILIYGPIGEYGVTANDIIDALAEANGADVLVRINSGGGGFDEGPAIYNALVNYAGRVDTQVDGIAYSMAALVMQAGKTRRMAENAVVMVHGAQFFAAGSAEDLRKAAEIMDVHTSAMLSAFTARGIPEDKANGWLTSGEDFFFTAAQALSEGIIDETSQAVDMAAALLSIPHDVPLPRQLVAYRNPKKVNSMPEGNTPKAGEHSPAVPVIDAAASPSDAKQFIQNRNKSLKEGKTAGAQEEMARQNGIRLHFDRPQFTDESVIGAEGVALFSQFRDQCLSNFGYTLQAAKDGADDIRDGLPAPIIAPAPQAAGTSYGRSPTAPPGPMAARAQRVHAGADEMDKYLEGAEQALMIKASALTDKDTLRKAQAENEFLGMSIMEISRRYLDLNRVPTVGANRENVIGAALVTPGRGGIQAAGIAHGTSDFSNLLENVASKSLLMGWDEAEESWSQWCRTGTLPDFKQGSRVGMSTFGDLDIVYENGEYKYGSFSDLKETLQLVTMGKLFGISRQALANDDLSALSNIPRGMGRAAARAIGDMAYGVLTSNPVMNQDGVVLFNAAHNNVGTAGPIDTAPGGTLDEGYTNMRLQTDPAGSVLNIRPRYLLVPASREISATASIADKTFADASAAQERQNPFQGRLEVVSDARLDEVSTDAWYLAADGNIHDTVEVAFLNGAQAPYLEAKDGWRTDGVEYKVRIDAAAAALDYRTMSTNAGT